jgi:hypothetical protein
MFAYFHIFGIVFQEQRRLQLQTIDGELVNMRDLVCENFIT